MSEGLRGYLGRVTQGDSLRAIAFKTGIEPSTLVRQLAGEVKVQTVVAICRAYDLPFAAAFVEAGFITDDEARALGTGGSLSLATDRQLVLELLRRVDKREAGPDITDPIPDDLLD